VKAFTPYCSIEFLVTISYLYVTAGSSDSSSDKHLDIDNIYLKSDQCNDNDIVEIARIPKKSVGRNSIHRKCYVKLGFVSLGDKLDE
jgi:hypothetical protein